MADTNLFDLLSAGDENEDPEQILQSIKPAAKAKEAPKGTN
jgi:hypothetical protein